MPMNLSLGLGLGGIPVSEGVGDALTAFFAGIADGNKVWFDFDRLDTMYQQQTGATAVSAATQRVGLWLDTSTLANSSSLAAILAAQTELLTNGGFASGTGWTPSGGWSITGGKLVHTPGSAGSALQTLSPTLGALYQTEFTVTGWTAGTTYPGFFGGTTFFGEVEGANGTFRRFMAGQAGNTSFGWFAQTTTYDGSIDDASLKLVPVDYGRQVTANSRPTLQTTGMRGDGIDDNLLTAVAPGSIMLFLVKAKFGVSGAARTLVGGTVGTSRCMLLRDSAGLLAAGVGTDSSSTIVGGSDIGGKTGVAALYFDGTTVRLLWQETGGAVSVLYEAAQNGSAGSDVLRLFATNNAGTAANFGNDDIQRVRIAKGQAASVDQIIAMMANLNAMPATL